MNIIFSGQIDSIRSLKDKSLKIVIESQELSPESMQRLFGLQNIAVKVLFSDVNITKEIVSEIEKVNLDQSDNSKSPGQRLRNVFFRLFEINKEGYEDFNLYYIHKMEKVIDYYKAILSEKTT